jgi:hypothetical protein
VHLIEEFIQVGRLQSARTGKRLNSLDGEKPQNELIGQGQTYLLRLELKELNKTVDLSANTFSFFFKTIYTKKNIYIYILTNNFKHKILTKKN